MKKLIIVCGVMSLLCACNKQIESIQPLSQIDQQGQLSSVSGILEATAGNYTLFANAVGGIGVTQFDIAQQDVCETRGNNVTLANWAPPTQFTDAFFFQNSVSLAAGYGPIIYKGAYEMITSINVTLDGIKAFKTSTFASLDATDQNSIEHAEGENRFLRAMMYFNLVNLFAKPYYQAGANDLGVALKMTSSATDIPKQSTIKDVYAYIVSELQASAQLMKAPVNKTNAFASTGAAWGLLSRVYLYMGGSIANPDPTANQQAIVYADSVINQSNGAYTLAQGTQYTNMFGDDSQGQLGKSTTFPTNPEIVFCRSNSTGGTTIGILYHFFPDIAYGGIFLPSSDLLAQFGAGDMRATFFEQNPATGFTETTKWYCLNNQGLSFAPTIFVRMGEIYLNQAEAYAKTGDITDARADLKAVHTRAGLPGTDIDNLPDASVLGAILQERRLELCFEGQNSFDYFRNGLPMTRKAADFNGTALTVQPTDPTVVFPTPNY